MRQRLRAFWVAHRTLFWTLHTFWALATGIAVIVLARERYGFVPWVVLFLVLTWASTMFFGREIEEGEDDDEEATPGFGVEATSYATRTMYQETMFFLIPFYAYSTVIRSPNVLFTALLVGFAVLSCLDLLFDRWLRTSPVISFVFFATVSFAATNLLIPILFPLGPTSATRIAAGVAVASSIPLALRGMKRGAGASRRALMVVAGVGVVLLTVATAAPQLVPPVPLRLERATFSSGFDREELTPLGVVSGSVSQDELQGAIFLLVEVFAPSVVPTDVRILWRRDGEQVRVSRDIRITAHELGFRVWDAWSPEEGPVPVGTYEVTLETVYQRVFGRSSIVVEAP